MAERLIPERPMPRWPSPVTYKKMPEAYFPVSGLPLSESYPATWIPGLPPATRSEINFTVFSSSPLPVYQSISCRRVALE